MNNKRLMRTCLIAVIVVCSTAVVWAQIYTCVDPTGRKITSDRPIAECSSQNQNELNPSGTVKRVVKPVMTADEQRAADRAARAENEEKNRAEEERRKNRALLARYPSQASHDKERSDALAQVDEVIKTAQKRLLELTDQRKKISDEMEFYKKDPSKVPAALKRQAVENDRNRAAQTRFIAEQEEEKLRSDRRFDDELARLRILWAKIAVPAADAASKAAPAHK
jgi:Domain of unknown function (DUF4124)